MAGPNAGPTPHTMEDWMRRQEKRLLTQERRPVPHRAADLLGPGIASRSVGLIDWAGEETLFNGFFYSEPGALNSPDTTKYWMGFSTIAADGYGQQMVWEYRDAVDTSHPQYMRTFAPLGSNRTFTPWTSSTSDSGWQQLSADPSFTKFTARWRQVGSLVSAEVNVSNDSGIAVTAGGSIANQAMTTALPEDVRPGMAVYGTLAIGVGGGLGVGYVSASSGLIVLASADGTGTDRIIDADVRFVGTYMWMV